MSVAFRRESDEEHLEPKFELPVPPGPNFVTPAGLALIEARVAELETTEAMTGLTPEGLNGTNRLRLHVFGDRAGEQARLIALLDNLGKGASGAAVQNLNLMLGLDEGMGLT